MFEITLGTFLVLMGFFTLSARLFKFETLFWKLEPMQKYWGDRTGSIVHALAYIVLPILCGLIFIASGLIAQANAVS